MCAVEVEGVGLGVAVGVLVGEGVEAEALDLLHKPVDRGLRAHGGGCASLEGSGLGGIRDGPAACDCKNGNGGVVKVGKESRTTSSPGK